jgi:hypothetical protein
MLWGKTKMEEKNYREYLLEYAKREFDIANFDHTELSKSMLNFLEEAAEFTNNEPHLIKQLVNILNLLVDNFPIVPITEDDFVEEFYQKENETEYKIWRCTRYKYVYRTEDGRYWNDRAIGFRLKGSSETDIMYTSQGGINSKQEIQLPYYPEQKIIIVDKM